MGDSSRSPAEALNVRIIALYPGRINALAGCPGIRFRARRKAQCTLVPCRIDALDGRSVATPEHRVPDGTPNPIFRAQFDMYRAPVEERKVLCVVLSAEPDSWKADPEQMLLSPIFDDGHRLIFEFRRAHIVTVSRRGELETRLVAVDPVRGVVGTKTIHRFDTRLLSLAARCVDHLAGTIDLFPMRERTTLAHRTQIPVGEANLAFGQGTRGPLQPTH